MQWHLLPPIGKVSNKYRYMAPLPSPVRTVVQPVQDRELPKLDGLFWSMGRRKSSGLRVPLANLICFPNTHNTNAALTTNVLQKRVVGYIDYTKSALAEQAVYYTAVNSAHLRLNFCSAFWKPYVELCFIWYWVIHLRHLKSISIGFFNLYLYDRDVKNSISIICLLSGRCAFHYI